jgi:tetratricopeptide (TPR) repeat protein
MYRDTPFAGPACYKHASAPAAASCDRCRRELCEPCIVYDVSLAHCIDCAQRRRRGRALGAAAKIGAVVAVLGGGIAWMALRPRPFDYGADAQRIAQLHNKVVGQRCDKAATLEYEEAILRAGNYRGALSDSDAFFAACGDWYRLRWVRYGAHEHLDEHAKAADEATKLMAHDPEDHDYPWWRGLAYEEMGRVDDAIADYKKTLTLLPSADRIPFNLANLLEQKGQFCAAREPILKFLQHYPEYATRPKIAAQLDRLRILGHCGE